MIAPRSLRTQRTFLPFSAPLVEAEDGECTQDRGESRIKVNPERGAHQEFVRAMNLPAESGASFGLNEDLQT